MKMYLSWIDLTSLSQLGSNPLLLLARQQLMMCSPSHLQHTEEVSNSIIVLHMPSLSKSLDFDSYIDII